MQNKAMELKVHELHTPLDFGKYKGKTLDELLRLSPRYIDWCLASVAGFHISREALANLRFSEPRFVLSEEAAARWAQHEQHLQGSTAFWEIDCEDAPVML